MCFAVRGSSDEQLSVLFKLFDDDRDGVLRSVQLLSFCDAFTSAFDVNDERTCWLRSASHV